MTLKNSDLSSQLSRGNVLAAACPSRGVLRAMTSQWGVLVLMVLRGDGTLRFSALRRRVQGVSERMLAETLKRLEANGLVRRVAYPVVPPVTEYSLTDLGHEGAARVAALADWVEVSLPLIDRARATAGHTDEPDRTADGSPATASPDRDPDHPAAL